MPAEQQRTLNTKQSAQASAAPAAPPLDFPLIEDNGFRVCGVPASASRGELQTAVASFRRALKLGIAKPTDWDLPWLGRIERTEGALQNATGRLADVERRLIDRLFWFSPGAADLARLGPDTWPSLPSPGGARPDRQHDIALLKLLHATVADSQFLDAPRWLAALAAWQQAVGSDDYWAGVLDQDQRGGFEPAANLDDVMAVRRRAVPLALSAIVAAAKADAADGNEAVVGRVMQILHTAALDDELRFGSENEIIGPMEAEIVRMCGEIRNECRDKIVHENEAAAANKPICVAATKALESEVMPRLAKLERIVGRDAVFAQRARGEVALAFNEIASCWTWADDFMKSEELLKHAQKLAVDTPAQGRVQENVDKVAPSARWQRDRVKPVKRAPALYTVNGVGTNLYSLGISYPPKPEWHYATLYFVVLFLPILPLKRYLVTPGPTGGWLFHCSIRFGITQWVHLAAVLLFAAFVFFGGHR